jgi:hypothetical protein
MKKRFQGGEPRSWACHLQEFDLSVPPPHFEMPEATLQSTALSQSSRLGYGLLAASGCRLLRQSRKERRTTSPPPPLFPQTKEMARRRNDQPAFLTL